MRIVVIFVVVLSMTLFFCSAARAQDMVFGANSDPQGATTSFVTQGMNCYLRLYKVDPTVSRLRIVNSQDFIFFDGPPRVKSAIFLPPSTYTATAWSAENTVVATAITGAIIDSATIKAQDNPPPPIPQRSGSGRSFGFIDASDTGSGIQNVTPQYPASYRANNYYNYGPPPPLPQTTYARPTSVLSPNFGMPTIFDR
jgi:hypothetical protein